MKIKEILYYLDFINLEYVFYGDENEEITGFSSISNYKIDSITWIKNINNIDEYEYSKKLIKLAISNEFDKSIQNNIVTKKSKMAFFSIIDKFFSKPLTKQNFIGRNTYISEDVVIGQNCYIGHNCVIEGNINIGDNTIIWNNVTIINKVMIGKNCEIQSGNTIGHDGFGYIEDEENKKFMIKHHGGVIIEDDVFIGMNNTIARATIDNTIICKGTKIAEKNHIAHNVIIGEDSTIICSDIYGSCKLGKNTYVTGSILKNQCFLGENSFVGIGSTVINDIDENAIVVGTPAKKIRDR